MLRSKETFEQLLADGLSLDAMGERLGLSASTVSWWLARHALEPVGRARFGVKPPLEDDRLNELVANGLGVVAIAEALETTTGRVRRALQRAGLTTQAARRRAAAAEVRSSGARAVLMACAVHGERTHVLTSAGALVCTGCRSDAVSRRRRELKRLLVQEAGGCCIACGYDASHAALHFHHLDPASKSHAISLNGRTRSMKDLRAEARKCVLLCANCHAEVENGERVLSLTVTPRGGLEPPNLD